MENCGDQSAALKQAFLYIALFIIGELSKTLESQDIPKEFFDALFEH
jgi:Trk-type K+ transport system membrane component